MNKEERTAYAEGLLHDVQRVRTKCMEGMGLTLEEGETILVNLEPWLFGEKNILPAIVKSLENGVSQQDVMNFAAVVGFSTSLRFQRIAVRGVEAEPTFAEVFTDG